VAEIAPDDLYELFGGPVRVYDSHGQEWPDLAWVDDETGEGWQFLRNYEGNFYLDRQGPGLPIVAGRRVDLALPIRFEPMPKPEPLAN
jgi:hypothetical protein